MSEKCDKCGTDDVILTRCSWCGRFTAGQTDLARLREENAALKREASTRLAERDLFVQASNESTTALQVEVARLSALVEEVREIVEDYYKYAGNNYQICGLNFTANDWLRRARGGN